MILDTKQARKSAKGRWYAPGKCKITGKFAVLVLCENYAGHVRGGIAKTWRVDARDLTIDECRAVMEKRVARKLYNKGRLP